MAENKFLARLKKSIIMADGAIGTMLQQLVAAPVECVEALNIFQPELVTEIHKQYLQAGSEIVKTNTFEANRLMLARYDLQHRLQEINRQGVILAKAAARAEAFIAGSVGPFIPAADDLASWQAEGLQQNIEEQVAILAAGGVDLILLETFGNLEHLLYALETIKSITELPVIASMALSINGITYDGVPAATAAERLQLQGADVAGLNCGYGIQALEKILDKMAPLRIPLSIMPNAGLPQRVGARLMYGVSEEYFASKAERFAELGACIIGGCCGTTPAHIMTAARLLKAKRFIKRNIVKKEIPQIITEVVRKSGAFLEKLPPAAIPVICEIDPPARLDVSRQLAAIADAHAAGAAAISMAENPLATVKISNLAFAAYVRQQVQTEVILHMTGRDRNLLGLQSVMLGADLLGIGGLLLVTGDPSHARGGAANVFDVDSLGLIKMAACLNRGKLPGGREAGKATDFSIGAAVNPNLRDFSLQLKKLERKVQAGAVFAMTQPQFDAVQIAGFLQAAAYLRIRIFTGIFPVLSSRTAEYLHHEVPGILIPEQLRQALARGDKEYQQRTGWEYTRQLITEVRQQVDGFYLIAPYGKPELLAELVAFIRKG